MIYIIDAFNPDFIEQIKATGLQYTYLPNMQRPQLLACKDATVLILKSKTNINHEIIEHLPKLKKVIRAGSGTEHIDIALLKERNIMCVSTPAGNCDAVGEHAVGMLLALLNNICRANAQVRSGIWKREANRGVEIMNKTIGVIGYGHTGTAFAKKISGFGAKVFAYDKYKTHYENEFAQACDVDFIYKNANIVSIHVPLLPENHQMVNQLFFSSFEKPIWFLNLSRGEVVDTSALLNAIDKGLVLGACLDVLENEKLDTLTAYQRAIFNKLVSKEKILLTPHIGGWTFESEARNNKLVIRALLE